MDKENIHPNHRSLALSGFCLPYRFTTIYITFIIACLLLAACGSRSKPPIPTVSKEPTREDIIQAVRRGVNGKTYVDTRTHQEARRRTCSQVDVDTDPYMPGNPELAKCPRVGATYTTYETVTDRVTKKCETLPDVQFGWNVEKTSDNRWRVTLSGKEWRVRKLDGASANVGDAVRVSNFTFLITTDQPC